jgi:CubicO group peptidase (beta-lactamase class C family)
MSWGLGFQVVKEPAGVTFALSKGSFGHGGAYATQSWADPVAGRIYILMIQRSGMPNGDGSAIREAFQNVAARGP